MSNIRDGKNNEVDEPQFQVKQPMLMYLKRQSLGHLTLSLRDVECIRKDPTISLQA